jgi:hypothetical protein
MGDREIMIEKLRLVFTPEKKVTWESHEEVVSKINELIEYVNGEEEKKKIRLKSREVSYHRI